MRQNLDNAPEKQAVYKQDLQAMDDAALSKECRRKIWLLAYANNNLQSCYHWQCDACYDECARRDKREIYLEAFAAEIAAAGY